MTCTARVSSPFFLKGAEQQFGRVQRRALVRNGARGRSLVSRSLIHIDPETDRSALWRLAAPGNPQQRQRQKRERGRMFMTAGRHYGINGCGCKSFVGNVDTAVAAGRTTLDSGEKRTKRGERMRSGRRIRKPEERAFPWRSCLEFSGRRSFCICQQRLREVY